jgi:RNA polymerase sigma-70 factor, ECF subfamily
VELTKHDFVRIVESNQGIIKSLCKAYYSTDDDRKDAFQDVVLQLWKSFNTFRGESKISTWIYSVGLNTILAKIRKERKQIIAESLNATEEIFVNGKADDDTELLKIVLQALSGLDKAIVILYLEGYKNKEISEILKLTSTNVSTRLNRVKTELKTKFKNQLYEFRQS